MYYQPLKVDSGRWSKSDLEQLDTLMIQFCRRRWEYLAYLHFGTINDVNFTIYCIMKINLKRKEQLKEIIQVD